MKAFHTNLHRWYAKHGRQDLPWRKTEDAYHIYLSEVMLQQTQVKTVLERFYFPFLEAFPTLQALADAPEEAVMKRWEGLGYYSRARNLHRTAKLLCPSPQPSPQGEGARENLSLGRGQNDAGILGEGEMPNNYSALLALPGIGRNTAHAIMAFAFHQPYPVLEANVKRIIHRVFALKERDDKQLWQHAEALLDTKQPFNYNQAMMDIGAMICTPKAPKCGECPAETICQGKADPLAYPAPKAKKQTPVRHKTLIALRDTNGRYYLTPRSTRFLGGLYGFVELEPDLKDSTSLPALCRQSTTQALMDYPNKSGNDELKKLGEISQTYSHFKLIGDVYLCQLSQAMNGEEWFTLDEIKQLPLSGADQKILAQLSRIDT